MMYETGEMTKRRALRFIQLFMEKVGTDYELNDAGGEEHDLWYVLCIDMELESELQWCLKIEEQVDPKKPDVPEDESQWGRNY